MNYRPKEGTLLLGKYEIGALIGEGAFGCVYRARFLKLDRDVAIKFINPNDQILARFMDELAAIKKLDHPNIVRLFDYDILNEGVPCIVMEFVDGRELGDVLIERGPFNCASICEIALQIIDALVETHNQGIVHCDLKPENIMLTSIGARRNVVKLIDFGVASVLSKASEDREHMLIGTPQYMAPEQILHQPLGPWTDIYAIGLILIEMFTGRFVFDAGDPREVLRMQLHTPADIPHSLACTPLGNIIARATEKDVSKRYNRTQELYDDLQEAASSLQTTHRHTMMASDASWRRSRSVHSIFTDIEDLLLPPPSNQGVSSDDVTTLFPPSRGGSIDVPLIEGSLGGASSPKREAREFDMASLNLGGFQHTLDDLTPRSASGKVVDRVSKRRPSFEVPVLSRSEASMSEPIPQASASPVVPVLSAPSTHGESSSSPATENDAAKSDEEPVSYSHNDALDRIEKAASLAMQMRSAQRSAVNDADLRVATRSTNSAPKKSPGHARRNFAFAVVFILLFVCAAGYLWSSGTLARWGFIVEQTTVDDPVDSEQSDESQKFVKYATIRKAGGEMAYVAAISGYLGASREVTETVEYRVIGTPTDAAVYLDGSVVCGRTPCKINVYGRLESMSLEIRKGDQSTKFKMPERVDPESPIIMVLK